jgi:predicted MPP superfamily phosphohydrolase
MFLIYLLTAYLIPEIYVFLRVNFLLFPPGKRLYFALIYILFISAFPLTEIVLHMDPPAFLMPLLKIGFYTMPFMLYLFLLVLLFDLFLLLNLLFRWISFRFLKSPGFRKYGMAVCLAIPSLIVILGIYHFNKIRVSEYNITINGNPAANRTLKIAFVSDFHIGDLTSISFVERFTERINAIKPDILLFGGDLLEGDSEDLRSRKIEMLFRRLEIPYGMFGVFGNHEYHSIEKSYDFYRNAGITVLRDSILMIDNSFYLAGRKDSRNRNREPVGKLLEGLGNEYPVILLDHRPTDFPATADSVADVQFSGHTHHGQLFPFNFITRHLYELSWGYKNINSTHFFVSSGIQLWGPPVRTAGKSEIMVVSIQFR